MSEVRNLVLVLGDQLDRNSPVFDGFDPDRDAGVVAAGDAYLENRVEAAFLSGRNAAGWVLGRIAAESSAERDRLF